MEEIVKLFIEKGEKTCEAINLKIDYEGKQINFKYKYTLYSINFYSDYTEMLLYDELSSGWITRGTFEDISEIKEILNRIE